MDEIIRTYRTLQRRTVLYGILAIALAMLFSLIIIRVLALSAWQGFTIGVFVGIFFQQISAAFARKLTPYA